MADLLRGKGKPTYTPHADCGDNVIVINAGKATLSGNKMEQKYYRTHSGWIGGLKETKYRLLMQEKPELAMRVAVRGMMPRNTVTKDSLKRLHIYAGEQHIHEDVYKRQGRFCPDAPPRGCKAPSFYRLLPLQQSRRNGQQYQGGGCRQENFRRGHLLHGAQVLIGHAGAPDHRRADIRPRDHGPVSYTHLRSDSRRRRSRGRCGRSRYRSPW